MREGKKNKSSIPSSTATPTLAISKKTTSNNGITTTSWPQVGFNSMHSFYLPFSIQHEDYASNISIPYSPYYTFPKEALIFHTQLQKLIVPYIEVVSKPNLQIVYFTGIYLVDVVNNKNGKTEKTNFQLEKRYSIEQNAMLDSKGILYIPLYDNVKRGTCLLRINTMNGNDWSQFTITPFTMGYTQLPSILSESNNCFIYMLEQSIGCLDLNSPSLQTKWNLTLPEQPYGASSMLMVNENNEDIIYASLEHLIIKISVQNGKLLKIVNFNNLKISSMSHMGVNGFLSFSVFDRINGESLFGVLHVDSGNYKTTEHVGLVPVGYTVSFTYLDHFALSTYIFKTIVFSSDARTTERAIHVYNTAVHVSGNNDVKILKPFSLTSHYLNTRNEVPRASITKDYSKIVYYVNSAYYVFDIASGKVVGKVVASKFSSTVANIITAENGRVYGLIGFGQQIGLESYKLQ
ncbi:hypothetical protein ABK040_002731 [Willaertia magna]